MPALLAWKHLNSRADAADHRRMSQVAPPSSAPDRLSIWPVEDGRYGIDASFHGATGYRRAEMQRNRLVAAGLRVSLRHDLGDTSTLRVGPLAHGAAWLAIEEFIGPRR